MILGSIPTYARQVAAPWSGRSAPLAMSGPGVEGDLASRPCPSSPWDGTDPCGPVADRGCRGRAACPRGESSPEDRTTSGQPTRSRAAPLRSRACRAAPVTPERLGCLGVRRVVASVRCPSLGGRSLGGPATCGRARRAAVGRTAQGATTGGDRLGAGPSGGRDIPHVHGAALHDDGAALHDDHEHDDHRAADHHHHPASPRGRHPGPDERDRHLLRPSSGALRQPLATLRHRRGSHQSSERRLGHLRSGRPRSRHRPLDRFSDSDLRRDRPSVAGGRGRSPELVSTRHPATRPSFRHRDHLVGGWIERASRSATLSG